MKNYHPKILRRLACPQCNMSLLNKDNQGWFCEYCKQNYIFSPTGALDLRLQKHKLIPLDLPIFIEILEDKQVQAEKENFCPHPAVDYSSIRIPRHVSPEILSWFPKATAPEAMVIDIGCCDAVHQEICEHSGFIYAGIDIQAPEAPILGDAHAIPFLDESFDFAISFCVLESIRNPFIAIKEAYRVLKPGAFFIGSVAFLEPFHDNSYFHFTHLGVFNILQYAGFEVDKIFYDKKWTGLDAISQMGLFPRIPTQVSKTLAFPIKSLARLYWKTAGLIKSRAKENNLYIKNSGAFDFIARKPITASE